MPSEMYLRGKHDAEADALDESYYQYYYDYRLAFDEVVRLRRRTRQRILMGKAGRILAWVVPLALLLIGSGFALRTYRTGGTSALVALVHSTATATATRTSRPTLPPPTPIPSSTPTEIPVLKASGFAVITGTESSPLRIHKSPGKNTAAPFDLGPGKRVEIVEGPQEADGIKWWKIKSDEGQGWAAGPYLAPVSNK